VQLVALTLRHGVPTIYPWREAVEIGGLMSYDQVFSTDFAKSAFIVARVLRGEKPADLPVMIASKFELGINHRLPGPLA
jgi:putative ABC transport system substrate-binding protein